MYEMKQAFLWDPETFIFLHGQPLQANEEGEYELPNNATWIPPQDEKGNWLIQGKWDPDTEGWKESGQPPEQYNPLPTVEEQLADLTTKLIMQGVLLP
jgi:hypothetical protein